MTAFTLEGFKRFAEPARFEMAPITLLLGGNSTGKSSVIQALLALKQSFLRSPDGFMSLMVEGEDLRLGSFSNIQSGHNPEVEVGFQVDWVTGHRVSLRYGDLDGVEGRPTGTRRPTGELCGMELKNPARSLVMDPWSLKRYTAGGEEYAERLSSLTLGDWRASWSGIARSYDLVPVPPKDKEKSNEPQAVQSPKEIAESERRARGVIDASLYRLEAHLARVHYVGPRRIRGQRAYPVEDSLPDLVGAEGQHLATMLSRRDRARSVNDMLRLLNVPYAVEFFEMPLLARTVDLRLQDTRPGGAAVGIQDVGFGISQLLPILTAWAMMKEQASDEAASLRSEPASTLIVEQPELHLHPAWQADLMRLLATPVAERRLGRKPTWEGQLPQVILETHSEIMVRQIQQWIRAGFLAPEDVSLIAMETNAESGEPMVRRVHLDEAGRFTSPWPSGFFPQREDLILEDAALLHGEVRS
jgi:predicted ATPase